jgi:hypothetical protein
MGVELLAGDISWSRLPHLSESEPPAFWGGTGVFQLASSLYNVSHSLFIITGSFLLAWWILKRVPWEMFGWFLHVLIDIPTHPYDFFPTPLFWPLSTWKFVHGFSWATPWFMVLDITSLVLVYAYFFKKKMLFRKKQK